MKYLSASELGITEDERAALIRVKKFLGKLEMPKNLFSRMGHSLSEASEEATARFNMNQAVNVYDCGTAGCIGGWMKLNLLGIPLKMKVRIPENLARKSQQYISSFLDTLSKHPLRRLFYPIKIYNYDTITPARAAKEITKFLTTGKATW